MTRARRVATLALLVLAAGCASSQQAGPEGGSSETSAGTSYSYSAGGSRTAEDDRGTLQAPGGEAAVSASVGGQGRLRVTVEDARGTVVFEETFTGSGGSARNEQVQGAVGEWTVTVEVVEWNGGFSLDVQGR